MSAPPNQKDLLRRAQKLAEANAHQAALALLQPMLDAPSPSLAALDLAGFVCFFLGQHEHGESYCRRALQLDSDHAYAHKGLGLHRAKQGRLEAGLRSLEQAMKLQPTWIDPYWDAAVVLMEAEQSSRAISFLRQGVAAGADRRGRLQGLIATLEATLPR